jgi:hypothetical protein
MAIAIAVETPLQDDVRAMVADLNAYMIPLTPREFQFQLRSKACRSASRTCSAPRACTPQACSHILDGFKPTYESTVTANLWATAR